MRYELDYNYINSDDRLLVEKGLAKIEIYQIRLDRYFSDEEKEQNRNIANNCHIDEWDKICNKTSKKIADGIYNILCNFEQKYKLGQWKKELKINECDFWVWCNAGGINNTIPTHEIDYEHKNGVIKKNLDLSYVTLSLENKNITEKEIISYIESLQEQKNVIAYIQYHVVKYENKINEICKEFVENKIDTNRFYKKGYDEIKFKKLPEETAKEYQYNYSYNYKYKKGYGYILNDNIILSVLLDNNLL